MAEGAMGGPCLLVRHRPEAVCPTPLGGAQAGRGRKEQGIVSRSRARVRPVSAMHNA